ncbi:hypothetical protein LIER_00313 [Lithospermum erythrorhizon]|uniref:Uncharacterized protein n=1 Tax=Lithospermum erythrorhizon TaxID=34254 RepID=A0AAV3NI84_LITER
MNQENQLQKRSQVVPNDPTDVMTFAVKAPHKRAGLPKQLVREQPRSGLPRAKADSSRRGANGSSGAVSGISGDEEHLGVPASPTFSAEPGVVSAQAVGLQPALPSSPTSHGSVGVESDVDGMHISPVPDT